jgi:hypothetical protein
MRRTTFAGSAHGRGLAERTFARLLTVGAAAALLLTACGSSATTSPTSGGGGTAHASSTGASSTGAIATGAISIPTGDLTAFDRCMLDAGFYIVGANTASGAPTKFRYAVDTKVVELSVAEARQEKCVAMLPPDPTFSEAEVRDIYKRWVGEYHCLLGLGYHPDAPPSVETFIASYYGHPNVGPWTPINGIHTEYWTKAEYDEAKSKCTLEFFADSRY